MRGSAGDGEGTVYVAHAWCPDYYRPVTVGPWQWWNVYRDRDTAAVRAARRAWGWRGYGRWEVLEITDPQSAPAERLQIVSLGYVTEVVA